MTARGTLAAGDGQPRLVELDALRGVAAFLVLTFHCSKIGLFADPTGWEVYAWRWTPLNLLVSGRPWVILFFILSGFVLACSLERAASIDYRGFEIRRLCRVYLPFVASILFSVFAYAAVQPKRAPELSSWFNNLGWSEAPNALLVAKHLLMTGLEGEDSLNPVMWSLVYELRISVVFPLLFLVTYGWPRTTFAVSLAGFLFAGAFVGCQSVQCQPYRGATYAESAALTIYFAIYFVVGILLARHRREIRARLRALPWALALLLGVAAIYAMILPNVGRLASVAPADPLFGLGGALLIVLAIGGGLWAAALNTPVLAWLGKVSYSLYLTHNIVLLAVVHELHGRVGPGLLILLVVGASLLVAALGYHLVEAPALRVGRSLSAARRQGDRAIAGRA
jgi:peptidoglycan/LPS O-acetylase OafA/YrhL